MVISHLKYELYGNNPTGVSSGSVDQDEGMTYVVYCAAFIYKSLRHRILALFLLHRSMSYR